MKKLLLSMVAFLTMSCATVNQVEIYGTVEDVWCVNGYYHVKTWCKTKGRYYEIITNRKHRIGEVIRIK